MAEFKLVNAVGRYVVVEPFEKSTVLRAEEIATVFKIISIGDNAKWNERGNLIDLAPGDLVTVSPNSIEKTMMNNQTVYYVRDTDIIATVKNE